MNSTLKKFAGFTSLILVSVLLILSCSKKPEVIGLDLVNANKPEVGYDTALSVRVYSSMDDSVPSDETSLSLLGSMSTEIFGRNSASFYTHLRLSLVNPDWGENPVADSVIFTMVHDNFYGNINTQQTIRVYKMTGDMSKDSSYWSNQSFETSTEELASYTFVPNLVDSIIQTDSSYLRIPMANSLADTIFNMDSTTLSSSENFLSAFKGIYVKADDIDMAGEGAIMYFDLLDGRSNVTIYYHNDSLDSLNFPLLINSYAARVGRFEHDYTLSTNENFINQVINGDTTLGGEELFLECLGGVQTKIFFPDIATWTTQDGRLINQAKLVIPVYDYQEGYGVSSRLLLFNNHSDGTFTIMRDQSQGENYFDGKFNESDMTYSFRISLHIQDLLSGEPDNGLVLFPNAKAVKATQIHLYGPSSLNLKQMQLQLSFTDVN